MGTLSVVCTFLLMSVNGPVKVTLPGEAIATGTALIVNFQGVKITLKNEQCYVGLSKWQEKLWYHCPISRAKASTYADGSRPNNCNDGL